MRLVRIQGLMHGEAAEAMGLSAQTVKRRIDRSPRLARKRDHLRRP